MTKEEVLHLGTLARIKLSSEEAEEFKEEISGILSYVGAVNEIVADNGITKEVGARFNVFREDTVTNVPGAYAEELLNEMPERNGRYLSVKKILNPDT